MMDAKDMDSEKDIDAEKLFIVIQQVMSDIKNGDKVGSMGAKLQLLSKKKLDAGYLTNIRDAYILI
jgi:hypothetical protein